MYKVFIFIWFFLTLLGCSSDLNFEQSNSFKSEPVVVANLISFNLNANQLINNGQEQTLQIDATDFSAFSGEDFRKRVKKIEMFFEFNNTINRSFAVDIVFLDSNNEILITIPFSVPAYSGFPNLITKTEIFEGNNLELLKNTKKVGLVKSILPGTPLTINSLGNFQLRSSSTLYFILP